MVILMDHQKEAIENLNHGKILYGGVGSGKTLTSLAYYLEKESSAPIFVITTAKKRDSLDWLGEAAQLGLGESEESSVAGVLTIDSWNNIHKYTDVEDAFFIFDEQRLVGTGAWVKSFLKIAKNNRWILLTATPGDTWLDYAPVFIANGLYKNMTEFKREHVVYAPYVRFPKVLRYTSTAVLEKYRNMLLVEMPFIRHTHRNYVWIEVEYDQKAYQRALKERWNPFENRPIVDVAELFRVLRRIVGGGQKCVLSTREILRERKKAIIFYNFNYELELLRGLSDEFEVAEMNGFRKDEIPKSDSWAYLVQYAAGAEAWNCIETDTVIFYSLTYSYKNFMQAQGRIDRLDTPYTELYYYILKSNSMVDNAVTRALAEKRMFNESAFAKEHNL